VNNAYKSLLLFLVLLITRCMCFIDLHKSFKHWCTWYNKWPMEMNQTPVRTIN